MTWFSISTTTSRLGFPSSLGMRTVMMSGSLKIELNVLLPGGVGQQQLQVAHAVLADANLAQPPVAGHFRPGLAQHQKLRFYLELAGDVLPHLVDRVVPRKCNGDVHGTISRMLKQSQNFPKLAAPTGSDFSTSVHCSPARLVDAALVHLDVRSQL
uniref:Uncharacterized protein n=1 Tax=Anopheles atroparvus TaxID=41427 RepID=A0A182JKA5_ANOAO